MTAHGTAIRIRVGTGWEQLQGRPMAAKSLTHAPVALALPVAVAMWQCGTVVVVRVAGVLRSDNFKV